MVELDPHKHVTRILAFEVFILTSRVINILYMSLYQWPTDR